ncbi:hypothetical protein GCM10029978_107330 [Actinoallomurus acanthiterrae]
MKLSLSATAGVLTGTALAAMVAASASASAPASAATSGHRIVVHVLTGKAAERPFAAGGGCSSKAYTNFGWISACVSASGVNVIPNVWIGITGNKGPGCYARIRLMNGWNEVQSDTTAPCTNGSHEGYLRTEYLGDFYTNGILANDANQWVSANSPSVSMP